MTSVEYLYTNTIYKQKVVTTKKFMKLSNPVEMTKIQKYGWFGILKTARTGKIIMNQQHFQQSL